MRYAGAGLHDGERPGGGATSLSDPWDDELDGPLALRNRVPLGQGGGGALSGSGGGVPGGSASSLMAALMASLMTAQMPPGMLGDALFGSGGLAGAYVGKGKGAAPARTTDSGTT